MAIDQLFTRLHDLRRLPSDAEKYVLRLEGRWIVSESHEAFDAYMTELDVLALKEWNERFAEYPTPMHPENFIPIYRKILDRQLLGLFEKDDHAYS